MSNPLTLRKILRISKNDFINFETFHASQSLTELYISNNYIIRIAPLVSLFPNLEILDCSNNQLDSLEDVMKLEKLEQLVELFIAGNPVSSTEK